MAHVSDKGRKLIENSEGLRLTTYRNLGGVPTIGYGHTGTDVIDGLTITPEKADELLSEDLERFERGVEDVLSRPATQYQFDALVSFAYNVGLAAFRQSTLLQKFNQGDYVGVVWELRRWTKVQGIESPGLVDRRKKEAQRYLGEGD